MRFKSVNPKQNFPEMERKWILQWKKKKTFEKSIKERPKEKEYTFYDGPPFATGLPHYGHILAGTMKDVIPRYQTMKGYRVERVFGWDCHGLPIENLIEKELELKSKKDIEEVLGVDKFNEACRASVLKYANQWESTVERMGRWVDFKNDYKTMDLSFMESIWWVFGKLWDKKLIYKGRKSMHICPRCVTPLSNFEVTLGYKDITDYSVIVKFKIDKEIHKLKDVFVLAWTTTPWTLPGNMYLAVGEDIQYGIYEHNSEHYLLAKNLEQQIFGDKEYKIVKTVKGSELENLSYTPIFNYYADLKNDGKFQIKTADFVSDKDGTGIVHIAGGYGEDDMNLTKKHGSKEGTDVIRHVGMDGTFEEKITAFKGEFAKPIEDPSKTDRKIAKWLEENGKLFSASNFKHAYPHCWRCDCPLINFATDAWFVNVDEIKKSMLKENSKVHWVPNHVGTGRFHDWLKNAKDWCISRNRYWGTPLPIWIGEKSGKVICIKNVKELEKLSGKKVVDIHKHLVDKIVLDINGEKFKRIPEVLDCWFESGSMPYAQMHYPFENKKRFDRNFPANFIAEGLDQTRGWFYTLMVLGCGLFGKSPFQNVIVNGLVLAEDGKKMSKKLKNYPDPDEVFEKYGADSLRFYLMNSPVVRAEPLRFSERGVEEVMRKIILPLWNSYSFFTTYASIDKWEPAAKHTQSENSLDKWLVSELELLTKNLTAELDDYNLQKATEPIAKFIDSLTNWYIRRSRRRFWKSENDKDKNSAYSTLYFCLVKLSQILAPFTPFIAEEIYTNLTGEESVHLSLWPKFNSKLVNLKLSKEMDLAQQVVALGHSIRSEKKIKVRQPLSEVKIVLPEGLKGISVDHSIIAEELNVKKVTILENFEQIASIVIKPDAKLLGPRLGGKVQLVINQAKEGKFKQNDDGTISVGDEVLAVSEYSVSYVGNEGSDIATQNGIVVGLQTAITDELEQEGLAREIIRSIQEMRKDADLVVDNKIKTYVISNDGVCKAVNQFNELIKSETLSSSLVSSTVNDVKNKDNWTLWKEHEIDSDQILIGILKV